MSFAVPFFKKSFLITIDTHSKRAKVVEMSPTTTTKIITPLRHIFAMRGTPETLVKDNGPQFTSEDFTELTKWNGIKHV